VWYSNNSVIRNNIISNNELDGIYIGSSINNTLINNTFVNDGLEIWDSYKNTVENNTVNDKPLVYLENVSDYNITDAGQVILVNCNNITAENLELTNTSTGIALLGTNNSKIINNNCSNNEGGIDLDKSCNNTIMNNIVSKNDRYGICVDFSTNNLIYLNNFISNAENVYSYGLAKFWNSSEKINYSYNNSQHTNCLGNYWDDYTGSDVVGDGIGDVPYIIDYLNKDNYPLVEPQENYIISTTTRRNAK
jgi:parallel beta-helix repeat protein